MNPTEARGRPADAPPQERTPGPRRRGGRIEGLDGLRAVAVIGVLVFHLSPRTLPGGFLGVDIFFVVSGFLITTLLLRELDATGRIDLPSFWLRRARRLLPALLLVVVTSTAAALLVDRELLVGIGRQVLGALTFSTNWVEIVAGTSYFARTSPQLLLSFWSLAVEEQFYLVWPPALALLVALTRTWATRALVAAALALASALLMGLRYIPGQDATRVYYGTDTHVFGLMLGVALALWWASGRSALRGPAFQRVREPLGVTALACLAGLMLVLSETGAATFRGGIALACLLTATAIACLLGGPSRYRSALQHPALAWVGDRSYGIYLWHWPVLLLLTAALPPTGEGTWQRWLLRAAVVGVTLALSALSLRWLETPVRQHGFRGVGSSVLAALRGRAGGAMTAAARVGVAGGAALLVLAGAGIATAPRTSEVQRQIEAGQAMLEASGGAVGAPSADASSGRTAGDAPERGDATGDPSAERRGAAPAGSEGKGDGKVEGTGESDGEGRGDGAGKSEGARPAARGADYSVPTGADLTGFGDSLMVTSAHGFAQEYPGARLDARSIRRWRDGQAQVHALLAQGGVRRAVVLTFGTNAGIEDEAVVRDILDALGPERMVVMVNLYGVSDWIPETNEQMERIAADYENVAVADWHALARAHPEYLQADGTHPGVEGGVEYVRLIERTFAALSRDLTASTGE